MKWEFSGRKYSYVIGSDLERDGMFLELLDGNTPILEIFFSDQTREFGLTTLVENIPTEVIAWAYSEAKRRLPPAA